MNHTKITDLPDTTSSTVQSNTWSKLTTTSSKSKITILDETQRQHDCYESYIDFNAPDGFYTCFWCKHTIPNMIHAIGCPRLYKSRIASTTFKSETTMINGIKKEITIREHICNGEHHKKHNNVEIPRFYTDGIFCSFPCCKAFIKYDLPENEKQMSNLLLKQMYIEKYHTVDKINIAPHWRLLKSFGGVFSIDEFRTMVSSKSFELYGKTEKQSSPPSSSQFTNIPIVNLFEEKIQF